MITLELTSAHQPPGLSSHPHDITEHAPLPIAAVEGAGHIVSHVNPAFCRLMDKPKEELIGKYFHEILPEKDECVTLLDRVFRTGSPESYTEQQHPKPRPLFWSYSVWPLMEDERPVGVMMQVTETAQSHDRMLAMNESLMLGSLRQHKLTATAENLNAQLQAESAAREITKKELSEKARLLDLSNDAIIVRDVEGRIRYWNHGAEELYGWSAEEVLGKVIDTLFQTEFPIPLEQITEELHRNDRWTGELVHTKRDGQRITVLVRKALDRDSHGNPAAVLQNITDITERKRIEEVVLEAAERFRFLAESMPQKIFTAKPNGDFDYFNEQWMKFTGLSQEWMRDWGWPQSIHPDDAEENMRSWKHSIKTGEYFELQHRFRRKDGEYRWHISRAHALRDDEGKITMWIGSNTDIDDMMRAQEELVDAQSHLADRAGQLEGLVNERTAELTAAHAQLVAETDERKRLEAEVAGAIEGERERLGHELHDGLVQELTGIGMLLHVLERKMHETSPTLANDAGKLCLLLEKAHSNARNLAKRFYPVELQQHGLLVALQESALRTQEQFGVSCVVECGASVPVKFKDAVAVQFYRIAQEAMHNAAKHAHAKQIIIRLEKQDGARVLTVKDDGVGLPGDMKRGGGMGLRIMQYRALIIHAKLSVSNDAAGGVLVTCTAPAGVQRARPSRA